MSTTVSSTLHILVGADDPQPTFKVGDHGGGRVYLTIVAGDLPHGTFTLTLDDDQHQRSVIAEGLRRAASEIDGQKSARTAAVDAAVLVAGGATPSEAVDWALEKSISDRPLVERVYREPQA